MVADGAREHVSPSESTPKGNDHEGPVGVPNWGSSSLGYCAIRARCGDRLPDPASDVRRRSSACRRARLPGDARRGRLLGQQRACGVGDPHAAARQCGTERRGVVRRHDRLDPLADVEDEPVRFKPADVQVEPVREARAAPQAPAPAEAPSGTSVAVMASDAVRGIALVGAPRIRASGSGRRRAGRPPRGSGRPATTREPG
jgi:hypothetical protein